MAGKTKLWTLGADSINTVVRHRFSGIAGLARLEGVTLPQGADPAAFSCEHQSVTIGNYRLRRATCSALKLSRSDLDGALSQLNFTFVSTGQMTITQGGRTVVLRPGEAAVSNGLQANLSELRENSNIIRVSIERELLASKEILFAHTVRKLSNSSVLSSGAAAFFAELIDARHYPLSPLDTARIVQVIDGLFVQLHLAFVERFRPSADVRSGS